MPLTDRQISLAKTDGPDLFLSDGNGLYLRVRASGSKTWLYRYKNAEGKTQWFDIGIYDGASGVSLIESRSQASALNLKRRNGIDPVEERKAEAERKTAELKDAALAVAASNARPTVLELFERWEKSALGERKDKGAEVRRSFTKDVLPVLGGVAVEDVKRAMIASLLDNVVDRGARIVARELLGELRMMFNYAIKREIIEYNPTALLKRDDFGKKVERDRILSDAEIRALPGKLADARMAESSTAAIWIMLSTCCRVGEISRAEWKDIDLDAGTWRIPPENAKNAKAHTIYLSPFAVRQLEALKALAEGSTWVLPARWENKEGQRAHVCVKSLAKQIGDRQRGDKPPMACRSVNINALELPGGRWTPHDLRRTGATTMGALGVRPDVIEKCLNHVEQNKVVRIYQRQELKEEQREAWRLLGERLELLMRDDDNVVLLRGAA